MVQVMRSNERGHVDHGWLESRHTFSFGSYYNPEARGYRSLRVINDDRVGPGQGFDMHPHRDMEILTVVTQGALEHRDSLGNHAVVRPGLIQKMTAGAGIEHSEFNASDTQDVKLLQIWIIPKTRGLTPSFVQQAYTVPTPGHKTLLGSHDARDGSVHIAQDADLWRVRTGNDAPVTIDTQHGYTWVHVVTGTGQVNGQDVETGDAVAIEGTGPVLLEGDLDALVFDLA